MLAVSHAGGDTWYNSQRTPGGSVTVLRSRGNRAAATWDVLGIAGAGSWFPRDIEFVTQDLGYVADEAGILPRR